MAAAEIVQRPPLAAGRVRGCKVGGGRDAAGVWRGYRRTCTGTGQL